jgi:Holliday junction resolvase RusA-like endonuclease
MGISQSAFHAMKERVARNRKKEMPPVPAPAPAPCGPDAADLILVSLDQFEATEFTFHGKPIGKPRMTRQDKFIMRPKVKRYWDFKAAIRAAAGVLRPNADMVIVTAWVPMPVSWVQKKKDQLNGQPCRDVPDWDNIGKAVCDALFDEDRRIWVGAVIKYWCLQGQEKLNVKILYAKS